MPITINESEDNNKKYLSSSPDLHQDVLDTQIFYVAKKIFKARFDGVLQEYMEDTDLYFTAITEGLTNNDLFKIKENSHPLKSSSYTLGFNKIGDLAKKIELATKDYDDVNGALATVIYNLPRLNEAIKESTELLIKYLDK